MIVLLDADGPLLDFNAAFLGLVKEETGWSFGPEVVTTWKVQDSPFFEQLALDIGSTKEDLIRRIWARMNRIGFCQGIPVAPGAQEAVKKLRTIATVEVLTAPMSSSPTWVPERYEALKRHFGFHPDDVHFVARKGRVMGDMLVDDKPVNVVEWALENRRRNPARTIHPVIWDTSYNGRNHIACATRTASWREVFELAKAFRENE